jgi:hypothetical protein
MMAQKRHREMQEARLHLEEVCIFLPKDIHNVVLQEDVAKLEMVVHKGKEYIAREARVYSRLW